MGERTSAEPHCSLNLWRARRADASLLFVNHSAQ